MKTVRITASCVMKMDDSDITFLSNPDRESDLFEQLELASEYDAFEIKLEILEVAK